MYNSLESKIDNNLFVNEQRQIDVCACVCVCVTKGMFLNPSMLFFCVICIAVQVKHDSCYRKIYHLFIRYWFDIDCIQTVHGSYLSESCHVFNLT